MKKKTLLIFWGLSLSLLAAGCGGTGASSSDSISNSSSGIPLVSSAVSSTDYLQKGLDEKAAVLTQCSDYQDLHSMKSTGAMKLLVVPVVMGGEVSFTAEKLARIQSVFFDENLSAKGDGNYFSLAEYYHRTSLGKLTLTGEVAPVLTCTDTVASLEATSTYVPGVPAYQFWKAQTADYLKSYDSDNDGYIDGIVFVYSAPFKNSDGYYWAFTSTFAKQEDTSKPSLGRHIWMSVDFLQSDGYTNDGHTIIHEFGHMLGLRDYYPTDSAYLALGGMSMMDYNILDHDPYSKMMLGWAEPLYYSLPTGSSQTITLKPFETSNQFVLLNDNWDHSSLDEYLLIEYYTPTEINALDSAKRYISTTAQRSLGFTKPGIKIYHVDSRIAKLTYNTTSAAYAFSEYVKEIPTTKEDGTYYQIGASNSTKDSYTDARRQGRYKQIALVENKSENALQNGATADDDSLFHKGDAFHSDDNVYLPNGVFDDKSSIGYSLEIGALSDDGATITISKE